MVKTNHFKVGRPKLADKRLKKESLLVSLFCLVSLIIIGIFAFKIITININSKYLVGNVYNDHINKCIIKNHKIDCGPNVIYMKYKIGSGNYKEYDKQDTSINVKLSSNQSIKLCYKTVTSNLNCNK